MKKLLLILLLLPSLCFARTSEVITSEIKVSCILDNDTFFTFFNSQECDKDWDCAITRYDNEVCYIPSQVEMLEEKAEENRLAVEKEKKRRAKAIENNRKIEARKKADEFEARCIGRASQAKNDFTAKKIYNRCMKGKK